MAEEHAQLFQLALAQQPESFEIDPVVGKDLGLAFETELREPARQVVHLPSHRSSVAFPPPRDFASDSRPWCPTSLACYACGPAASPWLERGLLVAEAAPPWATPGS
jgi:hypothetical protein